MPTRMTLSFSAIGEAMRSQGVRGALRDRAEVIARNARGINSSEGISATVSTRGGTNARGRPYHRIESDAVDAEFGTSKTARRRVLGRAAEQGN